MHRYAIFERNDGARRRSPLAVSLPALLALGAACVPAHSASADPTLSLRHPPTLEQQLPTKTPIKHVIIVVGENMSFDHLFATYRPPDSRQAIWNLRSRSIVNIDGSPGSNYAAARQQTADNRNVYRIDPPRTGPYTFLPQPNVTLGAIFWPPAIEYNISSDPGLEPEDQPLLQVGGIYQFKGTPDNRFPANLPPGPFWISKYTRVAHTVTGDPAHRFFQNWQQVGCSAANMSAANPSGCVKDLFTWVGTSVGWGLAETPPPVPFTDQSTFQGGVSMGYYNMAKGEISYFASLANKYAISDNYHQFIMGGTGPNSISIGTADVLVYSDANGNPAVPPADQIQDPNPYPGSNNWYQREGFYIVDGGNESNASYVHCADIAQPGVAPIMNYLSQLPYPPHRAGNCDSGAWYLVNNQLPTYLRDGTVRTEPLHSVLHSVGPSSVPTIGDALSAAGVSWSYYGEGFASTGEGGVSAHYCDICNPFQYSKSIMTTGLRANIKDLSQFYRDVQAGTLPAVSIVKPDDIVDGHPGTSFPALFEGFARKVVDAVQDQPTLWPSSAIIITTDESGGLYDSGYIQPIDFFGDGPRVPLIVVSPYAKPGYVDHTYTDHASLLKFIQANWGLQPLSARSRDNLPNPKSRARAPYFPINGPAVGDMMTLFNFPD